MITRLASQGITYIACASAILLALIVILVVNLRQLKAARRQLAVYERLMDQFGEGNLRELLQEVQMRLNEQERRCSELAARARALEEAQPSLLRSPGLVRFRGFEDVGGDLSFSAAVLSEEGDGIVITALHGRNDTRIYAKKVEKYASTYPLSDEEIAAIRQTQKR